MTTNSRLPNFRSLPPAERLKHIAQAASLSAEEVALLTNPGALKLETANGMIENVIGTVDPSVLVDVDQVGQTLRVATSMDATRLVALIGLAGYSVSQDQVTQVPSICCGGCRAEAASTPSPPPRSRASHATATCSR